MASEASDLAIGPHRLQHHVFAPDDVAPMATALNRMHEALVNERGLTNVGHLRVGKYVDAQLNRLALLTADRARNPEIAAVEVSTPIALTGAPRSGTTFLHSLLAQDPRHRSPLTWEVEFPSPPPESARLYDDPRVEQWLRVQSGPGATHTKDLRNNEVQRKHLIGPLLPEECGGMLGAMLRSPTSLWALARLKPYNDWLFGTQMPLAYRLHRRWLQHLQWRAPRRYWLLKYPMHAYALGEFTAEYPDAMIIQTHRSPEETVSSLASLMATLRRGAFETEDLEALGREMLDAQAEGMDRSLDYRRRADARTIIDVGYRELIDDPLAVVGRIYDGLGLRLTREAEAAMAEFIGANPQGKAGDHRHDLARYALSPPEVRERMRNYIDRFEALL